MDLAIASPRRSRSASVAKARPMLTATSGTSTIQPTVLRMAVSMLRVGEDELEVVQADEVLPAGVLEADEDRVEHRIDQEHAEDHEGWADEDVRPHPFTETGREPVDDLVHAPEQEEDAADADPRSRPARPGTGWRLGLRRNAKSTENSHPAITTMTRAATMRRMQAPRPTAELPRSPPRPQPDRRSSRSRRGHPIPVENSGGSGRFAAAPSSRTPTRIRVAMTSASSSRCRPGRLGCESGPSFMYSTIPVQKLPEPTAGRHQVRGVEPGRSRSSVRSSGPPRRRRGSGSRSSPAPR